LDAAPGRIARAGKFCCLESENAMPAKSRREQIEAMLADEPHDPELRYMLAMEHISAGDDAEAVLCLQALIAVAPNYPPAYHQAGRALQRLNRIAEARAVLSQGIPIAQKQGDQHAAGEMMELLQGLN
jgi:tetratricopeptide (TPR) repeat protein